MPEFSVVLSTLLPAVPAVISSGVDSLAPAKSMALFWMVFAVLIATVVLLGGMLVRHRGRLARRLDRESSFVAVLRKLYKKTAVTEQEAQHIVLSGALSSTGADCAYLVLLQPEPHIVQHLSTVKNSTDPDAERRMIPLSAREFWAPLFDGQTWVMADRKSGNGARCGYPVTGVNVAYHLAVPVDEDDLPVMILGVGSVGAAFAIEDASRLRSLLRMLWFTLRQDTVRQNLRRDLSLYEGVFEQSPHGQAVIDGKGNFIRANKTLLFMHGLGSPDALPANVSNLVSSDERSRLEDVLMRVINGEGEPVHTELNHQRSDGTRFTVSCTYQQLSPQRPMRILLVVDDVSQAAEVRSQLDAYRESLENMVLDRTLELKNALHYAETTRDRIDMILRSVGDGLLVTDMHNRIILMNRLSEEMLGVRFTAAIGIQVGQALQGKPFRETIEEHVSRTRSGTGDSFEFAIPASENAQDRFIRTTTSVVRNQQGEREGVVAIMHDASSERELDKMKSEFLSMAAHELRTPLTAIQGFSELLIVRPDQPAEDRARYLAHINTSAQTLSGIVSDLLDISKIESGMGFSLRREDTDLAEMVGNHARNYGERLEKHTVRFSPPDRPVIAYIDTMKMAQVIDNLLSNAVKYSPDGGNIDVNLESDGSVALLTVGDEGIGMDDAQIAKAFDKFYRANTMDGAIQGTGLGLAIVKHLVEAHQGDIWLESELGKGTTVYVSLPTVEVTGAVPQTE